MFNITCWSSLLPRPIILLHCYTKSMGFFPLSTLHHCTSFLGLLPTWEGNTMTLSTLIPSITNFWIISTFIIDFSGFLATANGMLWRQHNAGNRTKDTVSQSTGVGATHTHTTHLIPSVPPDPWLSLMILFLWPRLSLRTWRYALVSQHTSS